jgi:Amt family ammonium transporter
MVWFYCRSTASASMPNIATIALMTDIAAAGRAISALRTSWWRGGKPDVGVIVNGLLISLVAITAGCASVSPASAIHIQLAAAANMQRSLKQSSRRIEIEFGIIRLPFSGKSGYK